MKIHRYLRAYLAGIFVPTFILPLMLAVFILLRLVLHDPVPIERGLIFPMALVPTLWGLWNMLWLGSHARTHLSLGAHGAILPLLLVPAGTATAHCLGILTLHSNSVAWFNSVELPYTFIAVGVLVAISVYYLAWKYIVGFVNRVLEIG